MTDSTNTNTTNKPILVFGSINIDIYLHIDKLPSVGQTINTTQQTVDTRLGGKSTNQSIAAVRASVHNDVYMIGCVGEDVYGKQVLDTLQQYSNDNKLPAQHNIQHIQTCKQQSTGQAYILHQQNGDNSIILVNGANYTGWNTDNIQQYTTLIQSAACVMLACEIPIEINIAIAQLAQRYNVPVVLDLGGNTHSLSDNAQLLQLIQSVNTIMPNETELLTLVNQSLSDPSNIQRIVFNACQTIQQNNSKLNILVTLGDKGSVYYSGNDFVPLSSNRIIQLHVNNNHTKLKIVDTTGAGDCYRGYFTHTLYSKCNTEFNHSDIAASLRYGAAAAELSIQIVGAANSMPYRTDVVQYMRRKNYHVEVYTIDKYKKYLDNS